MRSYSAVVAEDLFFSFVMSFSPEHRTSTEDGDNTSHTDTVGDVFERFKNYLDEKVENLSSGLVSRTATETQKLSNVAEAEKLKFAGNKDQFTLTPNFAEPLTK